MYNSKLSKLHLDRKAFSLLSIDCKVGGQEHVLLNMLKLLKTNKEEKLNLSKSLF